MTEANAINATTTGIVGNTGTGFTGTAVTQYNVITGAATSSTLNNVAPSATSGVPLISQGAAAQPIFGTAAIAGGGTNATSFSTSTGIVKYDGTSLVTSSAAKIDSSNRMTNSSQPAFLARLGTTDSNVTGDGTKFRIGSGNALTVIFDQGSNFNTNGTFTAPIAGRYLFIGLVRLDNIGASHTAVFVQIITTSLNYSCPIVNPAAMQSVGSGFALNISVIANMAASDTATLNVEVLNSTKTVNVTGSAGDTSFAGYLIC